MKNNPYSIVQMFEEEIANYTGSPYAVSVDSCTNAVFLCCKYLEVKEVIMPKRTYLSIPMSVIHAGGKVKFEDKEWSGIYSLDPYPIYDSAKRLTSNMYIPNSYMCLSFHIKKLLGIGKGGMILTDNEDAVEWFKKARYEGRSEKFYKDDDIDMNMGADDKDDDEDEVLEGVHMVDEEEVVSETLRRVTKRIKNMSKRNRMVETVTDRIMARIKNGE